MYIHSTQVTLLHTASALASPPAAAGKLRPPMTGRTLDQAHYTSMKYSEARCLYNLIDSIEESPEAILILLIIVPSRTVYYHIIIFIMCRWDGRQARAELGKARWS